jgi:signal transduction histidine kinase
MLLDRDLYVALWNVECARITGLPAERAVGRRLDEIVDPALPDLCRRLRAEGAAAGFVGALKVRESGREVRGEMMALRLPSGLAVVIRDADAATALEQIKSDFIATVSHELRTPVTAVYGAAATVRRRLPADDERAELLAVIEEQAERLWQIVERIVTASALRARALPTPVDVVDVREVVTGVVDEIRATIPTVRIETVTIGDDWLALASPELLHEALAALVDNAIKYSEGAPAVRISFGRDGATILILVEDAGIGIPASESVRIFEPFARTDAEMARGVGGVGLGLFIVREQLRRIGGNVTFRPRPGGGSIFAIELVAAGKKE